MNIVIEALSIIFQTIFYVSQALIKSAFLLNNVLDGIKEQFIALSLGIPVECVSFGLGFFGVASFLIMIIRKYVLL